MSTIQFPKKVTVGELSYNVEVGSAGFIKKQDSEMGEGLHQAQFAVLKSDELSSITTVKEKLSCKDRFLGLVGWRKWRVIQIATGKMDAGVEKLKYIFIDVSVISKEKQYSFYKIKPCCFYSLCVDLPTSADAILDTLWQTSSNTDAVSQWLMEKLSEAGRVHIATSPKSARSGSPIASPKSPRSADQKPIEYSRADFNEQVLSQPLSSEVVADLQGKND